MSFSFCHLAIGLEDVNEFQLICVFGLVSWPWFMCTSTADMKAFLPSIGGCAGYMAFGVSTQPEFIERLLDLVVLWHLMVLWRAMVAMAVYIISIYTRY